MKNTDKQRLDWLEERTREGFAPSLVYDDNGHWAVVEDGMQNVTPKRGPFALTISHFVEKKAFAKTVRGAIDKAMKKAQ